MHFLTNYIEPLTIWLHNNPHYAVLITFLVSFSESLAIVGTIIPGSITMTALGILAGTGVMRIDLTFISATFGAIVGDFASYSLGYYFSDRLTFVWPFNRYPQWLHYGKDFFARYGSTSVLIGRFVGPMRSIIPVIAGMMNMSRLHFLITNVISAFGWAILYLLPGVLIGSASSELSKESMTRLFVIILISLAVIWLLTIFTKWLYLRMHHYFKIKLHQWWGVLEKNPRLSTFFKCLIPDQEQQHSRTAVLLISTIISLLISFITLTLVLQNTWISSLNNFIYLFFQEIHTTFFDHLFIFVSLMLSPVPLFTFILCFTIYTVYCRELRTLGYWLCLCLVCSVVDFFLFYVIEPSRPASFLSHNNNISSPANHLIFSIALIEFLILYIKRCFSSIVITFIQFILLMLLILASLAPIYLGENWVFNLLCSASIATTLCLTHWILYRRKECSHKDSRIPLAIVFFIYILATCFVFQLDFKTLANKHSLHLEHYVINNDVWWSQNGPLLPLFSTNKIGQRTGLLNVQYVGPLSKIQKSLKKYGWKKASHSMIYHLLLRASGQHSEHKIQFTPQFYMNKRPALIMVFLNHHRQTIILRLWRSNYHLNHHSQPIWLGSIAQEKFLVRRNGALHETIQDDLLNALPNFEFKQLTIPSRYLKSLPYPISPNLFLIKATEPAQIWMNTTDNKKRID